jgi:uridylate kinase
MSANRPAGKATGAASAPSRFRRVVLKLSGEILRGRESFGLDHASVMHIAGEVVAARNLGCETAVVIGGGNIFRGGSEFARGMNRAVADQIGMIATVINALMLQDAVERLGVESRVMTAFPVHEFAEPYIRRRAMRHLELGRVVIFGGGTGNPYFTTDSAAALRAAEIGADAVLKGTKVDGVYTADPKKDPDARRLDRVTFQRAIEENLKVMDSAAISICREARLPILVYDVSVPGNTALALTRDDVGTLIDGE